MLINIYKKIELYFWEIFIFTMSNSKLARKLVIFGSDAVQEFKGAQTFRLLIVVTIAGLTSGTLLYILKSILP